MNTLPSGDEPYPDIERFRLLYAATFGVESKPECDALVAQMRLSPEQAIQLLEDITLVIHHVFDAYFAQRRHVSSSSRAPLPVPGDR